MRPPAEISGPHQPPQPGASTVLLTRVGSEAAFTATGDAQAAVIFPYSAVAPRPGESAIEVEIVPLDPVAVAPPPPGMRFDGNAYRVDAVYALVKTPIVLQQPATIVLRYPIHAITLLRFNGSGWTALQAETVPTVLQIFGKTDRLGVFVAAAPATATRSLPRTIWAYAILAGGLTLVIAGYLRRRRSRRG